MTRPSTHSEKLLRLFESSVKRWRGLSRWYIQAHRSSRGEAVLQVVGERQAQVARVDNLFSSWRRVLGRGLQLPKEGAGFKRATWTAVGGDSYMIDVHVMQDSFDAATAKLWAEVAGAADATRCSYLEPAMPQAVRAPTVQSPAQPTALPPTSAQLRATMASSKTVSLSEPMARTV
jgi:hypothetical protein